MNFNHLTVLTVSASLFLGCSSSPNKSVIKPTIPQCLIAILPFANESNDLEAPEKARQTLFQEMKNRHFRLTKLEKIDSALNELGITDGGQLGALDIEEMNKTIPTDLFCYGTVVEFAFKSAVAISQRKVEIRLKLVESGTGKVVFDATEAGILSRSGTDAAGDLVLNVAGKLFKSVKDGTKKLLPGKTLKKAADLTDEVADVDLTVETYEAIRKLLEQVVQVNIGCEQND